MNLLLDTQVLVWSVSDTRKISNDIRKIIADPNAEVWVSVASIWEIAIKARSGKIKTKPEIALGVIEQTPFQILNIEVYHAIAAGNLPLHHTDPIDRMLIAQSQLERLRVVTSDHTFEKYDIDPIFI